jgi:hypothetical protein
MTPGSEVYGGRVYHGAFCLDCPKEHVLNISGLQGPSGSGSVVEHLLAKEGVASSNLVFRSIFYGDVAKWLRRGSAKPLSSVRFRPSPPTNRNVLTGYRSLSTAGCVPLVHATATAEQRTHRCGSSEHWR